MAHLVVEDVLWAIEAVVHRWDPLVKVTKVVINFLHFIDIIRGVNLILVLRLFLSIDFLINIIIFIEIIGNM